MDLTQFDGHTPGPWQCILNNPLAHGDVVTSEGEVVARIRGWGWLQKLPDGAAQQDANGRLVAAAPDLLAEVRRLTAELENAREVLRHVEWLPGDLRPDEPRWCMVCMSYEPQHAPDCALNAALAAKGE